LYSQTIKTKTMQVLRTVNNINLNVGELQANGLYNMTRGEKAEEITLWFDEETKDWLMTLPNNEFEDEFDTMVEQQQDIQ